MEDFREKWMSEGQQYSNATLPPLGHLITQILHDITTPREHQVSRAQNRERGERECRPLSSVITAPFSYC